MQRKSISIAIATAICVLGVGVVSASSHREAPLITKSPKVDNSDFYMFRSYETGRAGYVTFIANFQPLQDPYAGPNFNVMDEDALYTIHVDNDADAVEDISFHFRFYKKNRNLTVPVNGTNVAIPLSNISPYGTDWAQLGRNVVESFALVTAYDQSNEKLARNLSNSSVIFPKPFDNIGEKSFPTGYEGYANRHVMRVGLDRCAGEARVFAGQRKEGFSVALGKVFDLINVNPLGPTDGNPNDLANKNVTSIALEVPIACLTAGSPIIGAWSTASLPTSGNTGFKQVSRLSAPLVNEVVIGLPDKDRFNTSIPSNDASFATYVTNPTLPALIEALFPSVKAPTKFPRTDLVAAFLTGLDGLNKPANVKPSEMLRLNTSIAPKAAAAQNNLGALAGDTAGFPNGRRPGDDVVDIELRVAMGALLPIADAPSGQFPYTDGATVKATDFRNTFPYLNTPLPGAVN